MKRYILNQKGIVSAIQKSDGSLIMKKELDAKEIELEIHPENHNYNRRVKYNKKDFDVLVVSLVADGRKRYFAIPAKALSDKDSIHLKYNPVSKKISWSPQSIQNFAVEVTAMYNEE